MGLLGDITAYIDNLKRRGSNTLADLATNPLGLLSRNLSAFSESLPAAPDSVMPSGSGLLNRPGFQQWGMDVALNAPTMGLLGATSHDDMAEFIAKHLRKSGLDVSEDASRISGSRYLQASLPNTDSLKIRISDHYLPGYYGTASQPDYNLVFGKGGASIDPIDKYRVIDEITRHFGLAPSPVVRRAIEKKSLLDVRAAAEGTASEIFAKQSRDEAAKRGIQDALNWLRTIPDGAAVTVSKRGNMVARVGDAVVSTKQGFPTVWASGSQAASGKAPVMSKDDAARFLLGHASQK